MKTSKELWKESCTYARNWLCKKDIFRKAEELYLTRYVIFRCRWFGIYIHRFHQSDFPTVHDHPWNWIAIPLTLGYTEHHADGTSTWRAPGTPKFRKAEEFHWIELTKGPCWTLFMHGKYRRHWGFWTQEGWVGHNDYFKLIGV